MSGVRSGDETFLTLTREVLYELAWSYPVTPLAAELGVKPLMLTRFLRKLDVPYPAAAYWTRGRNGGHAVRANLRPPDLATVTTAFIRCRPAPRLLARLETLSHAHVSHGLDTLTNRFRERLGQVPCVAHSTRLHRGLQPARQRLGKRPPSGGSGASEAYQRAGRRLTLLNSLLLGLARAGCASRVSGPRADKAVVHVGSSSIAFHIEELMSVPLWSEQPAGGALTVSLDLVRRIPQLTISWSDERDRPLETRLTEIALGIAIAAYCSRQSMPGPPLAPGPLLQGLDG